MDVNVNQENEHKMFVTEATEKNLRTTAFWTKLYAILSFIGVGVLFLLGLLLIIISNSDYVNNILSSISTPLISIKFIGILYMVLALIMIIPSLLLYQFASNTKKSLANNNVATLALAIVKMKIYWIFTGVFSIAMIFISLIFSIVKVIGAMSMM
jgi:hypothetical protein